MLHRLAAFVTGLARRRRIEAEVDEELAFHLQQEIDAHVARGMPPADARRAALASLGGLTPTKEAVRDVRTTWLDGLWRDVRQGVRVLVSSPRVTLISLFTVVLIVGGITTIFTLVNGVLLRPLLYPDSRRLAIVESRNPGSFFSGVSYADSLRFRDESRSTDAWAVYRPGYVVSLDGETGPIRVQDMRVSPEVFPLLGIQVVLGRPLLPQDSLSGSPPVAVIGHDLWQTQFGGTPDVLGQSLAVRRTRVVTIVGVAAPGADVPTNWLSLPIVWHPAREEDANLPFRVLARLRPGVSEATAAIELAAIAGRLAAEHPETHGERTVAVTLLLDHIVGDTKRVLWIFFGAVACVLLIGVANLVSLQLVRNAARDREMVVRAALGASRWRLLRQLLVESLLVSVAGGVGGLLVTAAAVRLVLSALPPAFPRADEITFDPSAWVFAAGVSIAVGVCVGTIPAWRASHPRLTDRMHEDAPSATPSRRRSRLQRMLIALETAAALVLLVGAGLLAHSFGRLITEDAGMNEERLWAAQGNLPDRYDYDEDAEQLDYWDTALRAIRALPQVESATLTVNTGGPLTSGDISYGGIVPDGPAASAPPGGFSLSVRHVGADYFTTLGIPLISGRPILESDTDASERVAVLNARAAATLWPGDNPLGKRLGMGGTTAWTVVGIVPDFKVTRLDGDVSPQMYLAYAQPPTSAGSSVILLRAAPGAGGIAEAARTVLLDLEPEAWVDISTMAQVRWRQLAMERFRTVVLVVLAGTASFLALVGIFGLVSYGVVQRHRESALRLALGASYRHVMSLLLRQAVVPALVGLAIGLAVAVASARVLSAFLFEIQPTDPTTFVAATGVLFVAACLAALVPARRVLTIEPAAALRHE